MSKQELLKPTNDYVFGRIFGYQGNEFITQGLLEAITEDKYQVLIADFNLKNLLKIHKYHTAWHIREDEYSGIILTEKLEIHIIELKKLKVNNNQKGKYKRLENWLKFICNPEKNGGKRLLLI